MASRSAGVLLSSLSIHRAESVHQHAAQGIVKTALNVFLGNTEVGEKNEDKFFVYMVHNTIVRIDIKVYVSPRMPHLTTLTETCSSTVGISPEKASPTNIKAS
jgi:hypothetical protein